MPSAAYAEGFANGYRAGLKDAQGRTWAERHRADDPERFIEAGRTFGNPYGNPKPKKRKLSAWNRFVKANSKKPRFIMRSGKLNLKKLGVAFRKTPAGKKKKGR